MNAKFQQADTPHLVRPSMEEDLQAVTAIYAHYVLTSCATFEVDPPDRDEMGIRRNAVLQRGLPYLVADQGGVVTGYAYAGTYRPRPAYRFTVENSIYVHPEFVGQGIGRALLSALLDACKQGPACQMIAVIGGRENTASIALHESFQFQHVGILAKVGWKFERWVDTVLMQRDLKDGVD